MKTLQDIKETSHLIFSFPQFGWDLQFKEVIKHDNQKTDKGLPDSFFTGPNIAISYYPEKKIIDWTGNPGIVFTENVTGNESLQEVGNMLSKWAKENIG